MWVSNPRTNSSYSMFSKPSLFLHPSSGAHGSEQSLATLLRRKRTFRNTEPSDKLNGYQALHWGRISHLSGWSMVPDVDHSNCCCKQESPNCHTLVPAHCWDHDDHHEMRTACVFFFSCSARWAINHFAAPQWDNSGPGQQRQQHEYQPREGKSPPQMSCLPAGHMILTVHELFFW